MMLGCGSVRASVRTSAVHGGLVEMKCLQLLRCLGAWKTQRPVSWELPLSSSRGAGPCSLAERVCQVLGSPGAGFLPGKRRRGWIFFRPLAMTVHDSGSEMESDLPQAR